MAEPSVAAQVTQHLLASLENDMDNSTLARPLIPYILSIQYLGPEPTSLSSTQQKLGSKSRNSVSYAVVIFLLFSIAFGVAAWFLYLGVAFTKLSHEVTSESPDDNSNFMSIYQNSSDLWQSFSVLDVNEFRR